MYQRALISLCVLFFGMHAVGIFMYQAGYASQRNIAWQWLLCLWNIEMMFLKIILYGLIFTIIILCFLAFMSKDDEPDISKVPENLPEPTSKPDNIITSPPIQNSQIITPVPKEPEKPKELSTEELKEKLLKEISRW